MKIVTRFFLSFIFLYSTNVFSSCNISLSSESLAFNLESGSEGLKKNNTIHLNCDGDKKVNFQVNGDATTHDMQEFSIGNKTLSIYIDKIHTENSSYRLHVNGIESHLPHLKIKPHDVITYESDGDISSVDIELTLILGSEQQYLTMEKFKNSISFTIL